jgi:hypothetical protein
VAGRSDPPLIHTRYRAADDKWLNTVDTVDGGGRVLSVHETKNEAIRKGRDLAFGARSDLLVHSRDGSVRLHAIALTPEVAASFDRKPRAPFQPTTRPNPRVNENHTEHN